MLVNLSEAEVIAAIRAVSPDRSDVLVGIGDDGAVLDSPTGRHLVSVLDTLNEGVHFPAGTEPAAVGHRALAVNLSDLAAMGADPAWAELSISLPEADADWVRGFAEGIGRIAKRWHVAIVGGDTVRGPLSIAVHLTGFVEPGRALTRDGARPGDLVFMTGWPGEAMAGLGLLQSGSPASRLTRRFLWPEPRVAEGRALAGLATAAIDLSDGLATDAERVAAASGVRVVVEADRLPVAGEMTELYGREGSLDLVISGGDDYELFFTLPPKRENELLLAAQSWGCPLTRVGRVEDGEGLAFEWEGRPFVPDLGRSWTHFPGEPR
jgi:thiamine-monophosphate kinase